MVDGRQRPVWKYIPPPWSQEKPSTLYAPPIGAVRIGARLPTQTIQMIGRPGARVPKTISIDLGVADIEVSDYGRRIKYTGRGLETDVGGDPSKTTGMSTPSRGIRPKVTYKVGGKVRSKPKYRSGERFAISELTGIRS